ncbi:methyl-accepting chemotaxis protein [Uliginosibacterium aquaticum]|uniref:PAS domain S-box protein n=1 Tax=Uliginosibacterium aquaticum TaxID=2731212 RepID=A0ABX2IDB8_9RHOO|nr:PAS domain-containing methyl-accepting chemotaxis protein [Uliginosibacterium aquaticum]NSL54317.1 PAS domain S-box protein [Uliginosibacterium aquaticum]
MFGPSRKQAQEITELRTELSSLREIASALDRSVARIEFGSDGVIRSANSLFCQTMAYAASEVIGRHHQIFCEPAFANSDEYRDFWQRLRRGESFTGKFRRLRKDGATVWLEATYFPVSDAEGKVCKVIKIASDVTERVKAAEQSQALLDALNRSMAVIEFDMQGRIITANPPFLAVMGYRHDEITGQHHRIFCTASHAASAEYAEFWRALNSGRFFTGLVERVTKQGQTVWLEASYNPVLDEQGKPCRVVKFASDVTQRVLRAQAEHQSAETASEVSLEAEALSNHGNLTILDTIAQMEKLSSQMNASSGQVYGLGEKTSQITSIVNTIKEIADQTNLLALNAAIEAARAGESGRGFAVVADEVRKLAERTSLSTGDISRMISEIQSETRTVIDSMDKSLQGVEEGTRMVSDVGTTIRQIQDGAGKVVTIVQELKEAAAHSAN